MTNQQVDATLGISRLSIGLPASAFEIIQKFAEHRGLIPQALVRRILSEWVGGRHQGDYMHDAQKPVAWTTM